MIYDSKIYISIYIYVFLSGYSPLIGPELQDPRCSCIHRVCVPGSILFEEPKLDPFRVSFQPEGQAIGNIANSLQGIANREQLIGNIYIRDTWGIYVYMYMTNIFGVGDHFQVLKVPFGTCTGKMFLVLGDHFQVLEVSEGTKTFLGAGDHFQVLKVSEGTCTLR